MKEAEAMQQPKRHSASSETEICYVNNTHFNEELSESSRNGEKAVKRAQSTCTELGIAWHHWHCWLRSISSAEEKQGKQKKHLEKDNSVG